MNPNMHMLIQTAGILAQINPDDLCSLEEHGNIMNELCNAVILSRHALGLAGPDQKTVDPDEIAKTWASGLPEQADQALFDRGPSKILATLGNVPEGHVVVGLNAHNKEVIRGQVKSDGTLKWGPSLFRKRKTTADRFFRILVSEQYFEHRAEILKSYGWHEQAHDELARDFTVNAYRQGVLELRMVLKFANGTDIITGVDFNAENIMNLKYHVDIRRRWMADALLDNHITDFKASIKDAYLWAMGTDENPDQWSEIITGKINEQDLDIPRMVMTVNFAPRSSAVLNAVLDEEIPTPPALPTDEQNAPCSQ